MQNSLTPLRRKISLTVALLALAGAWSHPAKADTQTWTGLVGDGLWDDSGNWNPLLPGSADTAVFNTSGTSISLDAAAQSLTSFSFTGAAGSFTFNTGGAGGLFNLTAGGNITLASTATGTNLTETFNAPITLAGNYTFTNSRADVGSSLVFAGSITNSGTSTLTLSGNGTGTGNLISGNISDGTGVQSVSITNTAGKWTLSGSNSYSGLTLISGAGGTTVISGVNTSAGNTTLSAGTLQLDNASNGGLASGTLSLSGGILQSLLASQSIANTTSLTASTTISGANDINFTGTFNATATSTLTNSIAGTLTFGNVVNLASVATTGTTTITIGGTGNTTFSNVVADANGAIGVGKRGNLTITNTGTTTLAAANVYSGTTSLTGAGTLNLTGTISGAGVLLNNAGARLNESSTGVLSAGFLTITSGSAMLAGANTFTGVTTLTSGTVRLSNALALQGSLLTNNNNAGAVIFDSAVSGHAFTIGGLAGSQNINLMDDASNAVALTVGARSGTFAGVLGGGGSLTVTGTGVQGLSGSNSYTGATVISGSSNLVLTGTAGSLSPTSTITDNGTLTITRTTAMVQGTDFAPAISGLGNLTYAGGAAGSLALNGNNTYTGNTAINSGSVSLTGSLGGSSVNVNGTSAVLNESSTGSITGGTNTFTLTSGIVVLAGSNSFTGATAIGSGTLQLTNLSAINSSSSLSLNGGILQLRSDTSGTFNHGSGGSLGSVTIDINNLNGTATGQTLTLGDFAVTSSNSTVNVTGSNNYALSLGNLTESGTGATHNFNVAAGTSLNIASYTQTAHVNLTLNFNGPGNLTIGGIRNSTTTRAGRVTVASGTVTFTGSNSLSGNDNNSGTIQLNGGTLNLDNTFALGNITSLNFGGGTIDNILSGTLAPTLNPTSAWSGDFAFAGTAGSLNIGAGAVTLSGSTRQVTVSNNSLIVGGAIGDGGSGFGITKAGAGKLVLNGKSTYTGATTVLNGILSLGGTLANTTVTVGNATTASLNPTLSGGIGASNGGVLSLPGNASSKIYNPSATVGNIAGSVIISGSAVGASAGHLAPGNGVGTMQVGTLTLSGGSILDYEFNATANDFVMVSGSDGLAINGGGFNLYQEGTTTAFTTTGTYDLIGYTGALNGAGLGSLSVLNQQAGLSYSFGTATVGGTNYVTLTITTGSSATSTTYSLTAIAGSTNILTGGTTSVTSIIQNTGSGSADALNYSNLTATSGSGGTITGSPTNGGPLGQGQSGTNGGLVFTGTKSGVVTVTAVGSGTNATAGGPATQTGTSTATVNVYDPASLSASQSGSSILASNASGSFRASAKITSDSGLSNNQGFTNVDATGQQIDAGNSTTVANFDSTGKLNGIYTATKTLGFNHVTSSGSSITGGTGATANLTLTATVSGQTAGAGQVLGAPVFSGQKYGTTTVGGTSSGYGLTSNIGSDPHSPTTATIINGTASAATTVLMSFDKVPAGSEPDSAFRVSDILTLSGLVKTGSTGQDNSTLTDIYVLQLTYDSTATGQKYIGWYDAAQNQWVNATAGNSTGGTYFGNGEYVGSYASYLASLSPSDQTDLSAQLGAYGYDASTHTAWAVLNHESEFAVIPEPGTWGMIISGFGLLMGIQKLRGRRVGI